MKKLLILVLLFGCSQANDPDPKQTTHTSLVGRWTLSTPSISAEFEIVDYSGKITIDNAPGDFFKTGNASYPITTKREVSSLPPTVFSIYLISYGVVNGNGVNNVLTLNGCDVNKTYDKITVSGYNLSINNVNTTGKDAVVIVRKGL